MSLGSRPSSLPRGGILVRSKLGVARNFKDTPGRHSILLVIFALPDLDCCSSRWTHRGFTKTFIARLIRKMTGKGTIYLPQRFL